MKKLLSPARLAAVFLTLSLVARLSAASDPNEAWYAKIRSAPFGGDCLEPKDVDTPATPLVKPVPLITTEERQSDVRLHLVIAIVVETDGTIKKARILEATAIDSVKLKDFRLGVQRALIACKFHPAMKNGAPVRMVLVLPFDFDPSHPAY